MNKQQLSFFKPMIGFLCFGCCLAIFTYFFVNDWFEITVLVTVASTILGLAHIFLARDIKEDQVNGEIEDE